MQSVQPYEYTIYLAPDEDDKDIDESTLEQIESILPIETSDPSQTFTHQSDMSNGFHSVHKSSDQIPHQAQCTPCAHVPVTQPISTHNQLSSVVPNCNPLHSCPPLPQSIPLASTSISKSFSNCHNPDIPAHSPVSTAPITLIDTVPTINVPNLVRCETSTVPPLPTSTTGSVVTATTPAPLVTTTNLPNHTLSELCQNHGKPGPCNIVIKKAIILLNANQNPANLSSIAKAFSDLNDNVDDNDFEDLQENDDVTILDGRALMGNGTGIDSLTSKKSPSIGSKIIDLLEKVHHELQISNQYISEPSDDYSNDEEVGSFSVESDCDDEIEFNANHPNEQNNVRKCETGEDLVEACKNLSKTIASYQRPLKKHQ